MTVVEVKVQDSECCALWRKRPELIGTCAEHKFGGQGLIYLR
jgi:hypothetical protein